MWFTLFIFWMRDTVAVNCWLLLKQDSCCCISRLMVHQITKHIDRDQDLKSLPGQWLLGKILLCPSLLLTMCFSVYYFKYIQKLIHTIFCLKIHLTKPSFFNSNSKYVVRFCGSWKHWRWKQKLITVLRIITEFIFL